MKTCTFAGCTSFQFGGGYCPYHQYIRRKYGGDLYKPKARQRKAIPKESKTRKRDNIKYLDQINIFWDESVKDGTGFCFFCGKKMYKRDNIHHLRGRDNDLLLDMEWWVNAHNDCHVFRYHFTDVETLMQEEWFDAFMERLRIKDRDSYKKEIKRQEKAGLD